MARQRLLQGREQGQVLLTQRRDVTANATEGIGSLVSPERPRHFLLDFEHAQIVLCLIVVKGHGEIMHETQRRLSTTLEPIQQIPGRGLFRPLAPRRWRNFRVALKTLPDEGAVLEMEVGELDYIKLHVPCVFGLGHRLLHVQQQLLHLLGPWLLQLFFYEGQFPQVVDIAQRVLAGVAWINLVAIVDGGALEALISGSINFCNSSVS